MAQQVRIRTCYGSNFCKYVLWAILRDILAKAVTDRCEFVTITRNFVISKVFLRRSILITGACIKLNLRKTTSIPFIDIIAKFHLSNQFDNGDQQLTSPPFVRASSSSGLCSTAAASGSPTRTGRSTRTPSLPGTGGRRRRERRRRRRRRSLAHGRRRKTEGLGQGGLQVRNSPRLLWSKGDFLRLLPKLFDEFLRFRRTPVL